MKHLTKSERVFVLLVLISVAFLAVGCTHVRPYADIGIAYQLDKNTDYWLQTERSWQCSNGVQGQLEAGVRYRTKYGHLRMGYHHESWLNCGKPLGNGRPEVYQDDIRLVYHHVF